VEQTSRHARAWNCKHVRAFKKRPISLSPLSPSLFSPGGRHDQRVARCDPIRSDPMRCDAMRCDAMGAAAGDVPARCADISLKYHDDLFEIYLRVFFAPIFAIGVNACARAAIDRAVVDATVAVAFRQLSITANTVAAFMQHPDPTTFGPKAVEEDEKEKTRASL